MALTETKSPMDANRPDKKAILKLAEEKGYNLKGIKTWDTHDGGGIQLTLYVGNKKICGYTDDGHGGEAQFFPIHNKDLFDAFKEDVKSLPQWFCYDRMMDMSGDIVIEEILNDVLNKKRMAKLLKTKVIVELPDGKAIGYKVTPIWTRAKITAHIRKEHGDNCIILGGE